MESHAFVAGFRCSPGVTINGQAGMPDVWVCGGGRLVDDDADASPWDYVCGCVLYDNPAKAF